MDSSTRLDHAVFQLTPTRTRCDLLVCSGKGAYEKIASGLLEPFLSHLSSAREQIPRGGYSFTLRPPPTTPNAQGSATAGTRGDDSAVAPPPGTPPNWFTKGTLERFVRFVRTPAILERVSTIEKEILHIDSCIHSAVAEDVPAITDGGAGGAEKTDHHGLVENNNRKLTSPPKLKGETNGHDATNGENSKVRLQQKMEARKAMLLKEQGMAYARASVAGYDMANIDDLVSFADAFGASRLREACENFKDLCEKKEKDKIWMDELAAIEAYSHPELSFHGHSGIMLAGESVNGFYSPLQSEALGSHPGSNCANMDTMTDPTIAVAGADVKQANGIHHEKHQAPIGWSGHPYMYNFQNPAQQMTPFQGFAFPGMLPPYPVGHYDNAQPPHRDVADSYQKAHRKHAKKRADRSTTSESRNGEGSRDSSKSEDESDDQIHSDASEGEIHGKGRSNRRAGKKSSRTVVIRNINYITSERRDGDDGSTSESSVEDDINDDFLKEKVENIVGSLKKHRKTSHNQSKRKGKSKNHKTMHHDDADSLEQTPETDVNAKPTEIKGDEGWHTFQSILMRDEPSSNEIEKNGIKLTHSSDQFHAFYADDTSLIKGPKLETSFSHDFSPEAESLKGTRERNVATDPIVAHGTGNTYKNKDHTEILDSDENYSAKMKRGHNIDEELLLPERPKSENGAPADSIAYTSDTVTPNLQRDADWFIVSKSSSMKQVHAAEYSMFEGDQNMRSLDVTRSENIRNEPAIDDSFIVATRSTVDEDPISHWVTDMSIMSNLSLSTEVEDAKSASRSMGNNNTPDNYEPDDLLMVLERNTETEPLGASWTPEIEYTADITFNAVKESNSVHETQAAAKPPTVKGTVVESNSKSKVPSKDAKSKLTRAPVARTKPEIISRSRKPSIMSRDQIQKNKMIKEEENRKRLEELMVQRQKRIAERSSTGTTSPATAKMSTTKPEKRTSRPIQGGR